MNKWLHLLRCYRASMGIKQTQIMLLKLHNPFSCFSFLNYCNRFPRRSVYPRLNLCLHRYLQRNNANTAWSGERLWLIIHYAWHLDPMTRCWPHRRIHRQGATRPTFVCLLIEAFVKSVYRAVCCNCCFPFPPPFKCSDGPWPNLTQICRNYASIKWQ